MEFDLAAFTDQSIRLAVAVALGGVIGAERELDGHWAGVRTHMMVSLGAAIFSIVAQPFCQESPAQITRVIQGVAAGIGFLGAGTILKLDHKRKVMGLTTAASIWLAAAVGTAVGLGQLPLAVASTAMAIVVLLFLRPLRWLLSKLGRDEPHQRSEESDS
ncbi:MgtC/SapB family protein [Pirellulimonas nuda]|nr:MgtC/SapB family protein [Pirellulimonas nuda]